MYHWIDHTAEVELRIEAASPEAVLREALEAVAELLGEPARAEPAVREVVEVEASDRAALLAAWIEELVFLAETRGLICEQSDALDLEGARLHATVEARPGTPRHLVKAVTYHGLRFERCGDCWEASAVLDV